MKCFLKRPKKARPKIPLFFYIQVYFFITDIDLEILLKFNKIKELSDDIRVIVKAIENSKLLEVII